MTTRYVTIQQDVTATIEGGVFGQEVVGVKATLENGDTLIITNMEIGETATTADTED